MINCEVVKVYDWFDIEKEIAKRVGVHDLHGGYFNPITGKKVASSSKGVYRNFWHKALDAIIPDNMRNDSIVTMYGIEDWELNKEYYLNLYESWTEPYFQAYCDIMEELDPEFNGIQVKFGW